MDIIKELFARALEAGIPASEVRDVAENIGRDDLVPAITEE